MSMNPIEKCCAHCPGRTALPNNRRAHECCQPKYVTGNLRISSLRKHVPACLEYQRRAHTAASNPHKMSGHQEVGLAKSLHVENLQHQPLPDKVDDDVFKINKDRALLTQELQKKVHYHEDYKPRGSRNCYEPVLGRKTPGTKMDLAICWDIPVDPIYEPPRATHVDGSYGGLAPAIFTLVQDTPRSTRACNRSGNMEHDSGFKKETNRERHGCEDKIGNSDYASANEKEQEKKHGCACNVPIKSTKRKCFACEHERCSIRDPRLIRSSIDIACRTPKSEPANVPAKFTAQRPRTPFANRSFQIDTLSPPFSIENNCRDGEYPEHWRLMSVYQQSYRNPQKRGHFGRR